MKAELALLERLRGCWPVGAPPPVLLCDRGFAKGELVQWLQQRCMCFIIRVPRSHHLYSRRGQLLSDPPDADPPRGRPGLLHPPLGKAYLIPHVTYTQEWGRPVHLAVTAKLDPKIGNRRERRLITNLEESRLWHVPRLYAFRMSPEEAHRDHKRGHAARGFALCHLGRVRRDRLQRYLLVLSLLSCFLVLVAETEREARAWLKRQHWGLGLLTMGLDLLHAAGKSDAGIESIREDDAPEPAFHCSGKPGTVTYSIVITGDRRGIRFTRRRDPIRDWLRPLALRWEPSVGYVA